jgi:hypothetical protein
MRRMNASIAVTAVPSMTGVQSKLGDSVRLMVAGAVCVTLSTGLIVPFSPCLRCHLALGRIPVGAVVHEHRELHECGRQVGAIKPLVGHRDQTWLPGIVAGLDGVESSKRGVSLREVAKRLFKTRVSHPRKIGPSSGLTRLASRRKRYPTVTHKRGTSVQPEAGRMRRR